MGNYASGASPPKAAGEQFAEGEAAGARPPYLVVPHRRERRPRGIKAMGNYASGASPPKAAGEQFAEGEAAGARPPFLVARQSAGASGVRAPLAACRNHVIPAGRVTVTRTIRRSPSLAQRCSEKREASPCNSDRLERAGSPRCGPEGSRAREARRYERSQLRPGVCARARRDAGKLRREGEARGCVPVSGVRRCLLGARRARRGLRHGGDTAANLQARARRQAS